MSDQENLPEKTTKTKDPVGATGKISPGEALSALTQLVSTVREAIQIHETESTKREKLKAYRDIEVARIKASEKALKDYFDLIFEERCETHRRLFDSLDQALASGDIPAMQTIVGGIVEVARTTPLEGLGNLAELRRAMDDPNTIFDL